MGKFLLNGPNVQGKRIAFINQILFPPLCSLEARPWPGPSRRSVFMVGTAENEVLSSGNKRNWGKYFCFLLVN